MGGGGGGGAGGGAGACMEVQQGNPHSRARTRPDIIRWLEKTLYFRGLIPKGQYNWNRNLTSLTGFCCIQQSRIVHRDAQLLQ